MTDDASPAGDVSGAVDRRLQLRRGALRALRAVGLGRLLPLHPLPAAQRTAAAANGRAAHGSFRILSGEEHLRAWKPETGFEKWFCGECGSALFSRSSTDPGEVGVRLGTLDADPGIRPSYRQYVDYAAPWEPLARRRP